MDNPLAASGKPLFFAIAEPGRLDLGPPENRMGRSVRLAVRSLSVMQKEALAVGAPGAAAWRLASDEGDYLGGLDAAPCPLSFMTVGMVAATMNEILALAAQRGIAIRDIRLIQDNYYTMKGSAIRGDMVGGARDVELEVQIDADADRDALGKLAQDATAASPLHGLLRSSLPSFFALTHNGHRIPLGRALPVEGAVADDPAARFDRATPAAGQWDGLVVRGGMSPKTAEATSSAGSSLAEEQDRILHVRGICRLRPDGVKEIEQHLYNPLGSVFTFLCDEAPENGGGGRAPDAASYVAAGIGFCFMTQLGRYAKIVRKDLRSYRIVQDLHLPPGGASGGTGRAGAAGPVETHVFLETGEDDDFARRLVEIGERTCFLHALCKAELKTRVRISPYR
jgi:uncharacterized OsmC-like protein